MTRGGLRGRVLLSNAAAATVALCIPASASAQAGADPGRATCAVGKTLLDLKLPDEALEVYAEVLRRSPDSACARAGLTVARTAASRPASCATASAFRSVSATEAAKEEYLDVLRGDPKSKCAIDGLKAINTAAAKSATSCDAANALREEGQDDAAKTAYQEVLKADPTSKCAKEGLDALDDGDTPLEWTKTVLREVLFPIAVLVLLPLAFAFVLLAQFERPRKLFIRNKWIDRLLAPRVRVQDIEDAGADPAIGKGITARVRETLVKPGGPYRLDRISGREGLDSAVEAVEEVAPQLKTLSSLTKALAWILPRARLTTVGTLQARGAQGAGVTVSVEGTRADPATTIWTGPEAEASDDDSTDRFQSLAVPAAAWIDYEVRETLDEPKPSVTNSARSYALLQGGLDSVRRGDDEAGIRFYSAAIDDDPRNAAALVNLANLRARNEKDWDEALYLLERAIEILREP